MTNPTKAAASEHTRLQNEFGADHWVRNPAAEYRRPTLGRGLFAGLQDTKHYNVENGWARRKSDPQPGLLGSLWSRLTGA
ncbi:hypothetical protein N7452_009232 [Penicillium brevicompactum]|uniref:Uncharacterized protein n=1 Tax=Penicillium brevicompactum TaxID=5074 RepID=A0A9W9Q7X5_PENBR|nr:hypothetical protein N7452_009232 [Penicillium brevicompactum]